MILAKAKSEYRRHYIDRRGKEHFISDEEVSVLVKHIGVHR